MTVKFGVALPNCTEGLCYPTGFTSPEVIARMAQAAEQLGFDSVWCNDHFTTQHYVRERWPQPPNYYEPLITLTAVAAATTRIRLGTCVIVVPLREPVLLAKQAATLDVFSQGRLIFGVGVGAYREEFVATYPRRNGQHRGAIHEEGLEALSRLLRDRRASFEGRYLQFEDIELFPKPIQQPLPMWTSGNTRVAAERAGRWCQGWLPAVMPPSTLSEYAAILLSLRESTFKDQDLSSVENINLIGTSDEIGEKIDALIAAGCTYFPGLILSTSSVEETLEQMEQFAEQVLPRFTTPGVAVST
ncbi:MAG: TIGR03619 family F420-dependent LLM class oxidoreductase [Chloroflexi bacterium]|nr:TIGR03619 family F420-dependent LLM class oxidoreductase [Chloroflexota bacterium]